MTEDKPAKTTRGAAPAPRRRQARRCGAAAVGLHPPGRVRQCFGDDQERAFFAALVSRDGPRLVLRGRNGEDTAWQARCPASLERILSRADLTRRDGCPVVLAHPGGLMAFAAGPERLPDRVRALFVVGLAEQMLPAASEGQPGFCLLDATPLPRRDAADRRPGRLQRPGPPDAASSSRRTALALAGWMPRAPV